MVPPSSAQRPASTWPATPASWAAPSPGAARGGVRATHGPRPPTMDLTDQSRPRFFGEERPEAVIDAAAKVGGIMANWEQPWEFIEQNLLIETQPHRRGVAATTCSELSSSAARASTRARRRSRSGRSTCSPGRWRRRTALRHRQDRRHRAVPQPEPRVRHRLPLAHADQPVRPRRQLRPNSSHVLPAMIRKFHEAKVAGGGRARPERARALGHRQRRAASSCTWRTSAGPSPSACSTCTRPTSRRPAQRRLRRGRHHPRPRPHRPARRRLRGPRPVGRLQARRHPAQAHGRHPHQVARLGARSRP